MYRKYTHPSAWQRALAADEDEHAETGSEHAPVYGHRGALAYDSDGVARSQTEVTQAALRLLSAPRLAQLASAASTASKPGPSLVLDVGCGTGMCGDVLGRAGMRWVGTDISKPMLMRAAQRDHQCSTGLLLQDMGQGLPFRDGVYDAAVAISAVHYLITPGAGRLETRAHSHAAGDNLLVRFFTALRRVLRRSARAVLQCTGPAPDLARIEAVALSCGFYGGFVLDMPHLQQGNNDNNNKHLQKYFLCLGPDDEKERQKGHTTANPAATQRIWPLCPLAHPRAATCALWYRRGDFDCEHRYAQLKAQHVAFAARIRRMRQRSNLWHKELEAENHRTVAIQQTGGIASGTEPTPGKRRMSLADRLKELDSELHLHEQAIQAACASSSPGQCCYDWHSLCLPGPSTH